LVASSRIRSSSLNQADGDDGRSAAIRGRNHHVLLGASVGAKIEIGSVPSKMGMSAVSTLPAMSHAAPDRNEISVAKLLLTANAAAETRATGP